MKKLLYAIRMWLLDVLGGVPKSQYYDDLYGLLHSKRKEFDALCHDYNEEIADFRVAVQEICRRSENTYYDWCCDQCACECERRNGWCSSFEPVHYEK